MSFLDDLDETALVPAPQLASEKKQVDKIRQREDRILDKALRTVEDIGAAADIDDDHDDSIPEEWIREVGLEEAGRRLRVAKDARRNKKDAPVYLEHTRAVAVGILKARESRPLTVNALNATFLLAAPPTAQGVMADLGARVAIAPPAPQHDYPIIDIEPEDEEK